MNSWWAREKITILRQHPTDPLTPFSIFWFPPFCFLILFRLYSTCTAETWAKLSFSVWRTIFWANKNLRWTLKGEGVCLKKKPENIPKNIEMAQNWFSGFGSLLKTNLATKNSYDTELRVCRSIFGKISTSPIELSQFYIIRIFRCQIRVQTNFGPFLYLWENLRFFSNKPLHP